MTGRVKFSIVALCVCSCYLRGQVRSPKRVNGGLEEKDREGVRKEGVG